MKDLFAERLVHSSPFVSNPVSFYVLFSCSVNICVCL